MLSQVWWYYIQKQKMNTIVVFKLNESRKPKNIMNLFYKIVASINKIYWRKIRVIMTGQFSTCFYLLLSLLVERLWICFCCLAFILTTTMLILLFLRTNFEKNLSRLTKITHFLLFTWDKQRDSLNTTHIA